MLALVIVRKNRDVKIRFCMEIGVEKFRYCLRVGTFGTESAVRKRGGSRNLPYLNAKPRQIPLLGTYACTVTNSFLIKGNRLQAKVFYAMIRLIRIT